MEVIPYLFNIFLKIHMYLLYLILSLYLFAEIGGLHFFIKEFNRKKSDTDAEGASLNNSTFYFLFGTVVFIYELYFSEVQTVIPKWFCIINFGSSEN